MSKLSIHLIIYSKKYSRLGRQFTRLIRYNKAAYEKQTGSERRKKNKGRVNKMEPEILANIHKGLSR